MIILIISGNPEYDSTVLIFAGETSNSGWPGTAGYPQNAVISNKVEVPLSFCKYLIKDYHLAGSGDTQKEYS